MVNRNLIRGLDLNEQSWEAELQEALATADPTTFELQGTAELGQNKITKGRILRVEGDWVLVDGG